MLTPPAGFGDDDVVRALGDGWGRAAVSVEHRPDGFGSHHWEVVDRDGVRWFVTVDVLEPIDVDAEARLRAALGAAAALRTGGITSVIAPVPTVMGEVLLVADGAGDRVAVACYPFVDGEHFDWGHPMT